MNYQRKGVALDPLSALALSVLSVAVFAYVTYGAVRKGVIDGLKKFHEQRDQPDQQSGDQ